MFRKTWLWATVAILVVGFVAGCGDDDDNANGDATAESTPGSLATVGRGSGDVVLATTTSTQDSGLLDVLAQMFEDETDFNLQVIAVGSGQAIEMGRRGDADVVLAHSPAAEQGLVDEGSGIERIGVMHNDFVVVGPEGDPAGIAGLATINEVMAAIAESETGFVSRGDDSGTHALEMRLWAEAAIDPAGAGWYEETGQGMGATLQVASQRQAYTVTDRATYLSQGDILDLAILFEGDESLLNYYHVIVVNPERHSGVNFAGAQAFADFLVREDVQAVIAEFGVEEYGEPLFFVTG